MKNSNSGCALVVADGKLVGIFTEHDVLKKLTGEAGSADIAGSPAGQPGGGAMLSAAQREARAPAKVTVKELMSSNPETLREKDSVAEALNKMSLGRYRHIPFVKPDGSHAVASIQSVLQYIAREDW